MYLARTMFSITPSTHVKHNSHGLNSACRAFQPFRHLWFWPSAPRSPLSQKTSVFTRTAFPLTALTDPCPSCTHSRDKGNADTVWDWASCGKLHCDPYVCPGVQILSMISLQVRERERWSCLHLREVQDPGQVDEMRGSGRGWRWGRVVQRL